MKTLSPEQIARIRAYLPPEEAALFSETIEPPWQARQRRLDQRDALICNELAGTAGACLTRRACSLERRLRRPPAGDAAAARILALNGGPLGWRHLARVARGGRNPGLRKNNDVLAQAAPPWSTA